jgi:2,3-bisphosphoglycerate-independent phosphoglycerate mutase
MKYVILIGDGMGDYPREELGGRTLLQAAKTPNMDRLAREGLLGLAQTIPADKEPGSDVANMSIMGYDPAKYHTGRSPIEAAAMGVELAADEVAFRCNLVTLDHQSNRVVMADYSAAHIKSEEAEPFIRALDAALGAEGLRFTPGVSYRHLLVWRNGPLKAATVPPHDRTGQAVDDVLSDSGELGRVTALTRASWPVLMAHPGNQERAARGLGPVNSIWLWGQGTRPSYPTLQERYGLTGVAISAVDLVRGLGRLAGLDPVEVPGATGYLDTNYAGKVAAALKGLETGDFAFVHVEAPDEAGHGGKLAPKMQAIEDFDEKVVGPLLVGLKALGPHRVLLAADHYTPLSARTHTREPVPFVLWDSEVRGPGGEGYNEPSAARAGLLVPQAHTLLERLVDKK